MGQLEPCLVINAPYDIRNPPFGIHQVVALARLATLFHLRLHIDGTGSSQHSAVVAYHTQMLVTLFVPPFRGADHDPRMLSVIVALEACKLLNFSKG